jgi:hypothetical protein
MDADGPNSLHVTLSVPFKLSTGLISSTDIRGIPLFQSTNSNPRSIYPFSGDTHTS